MGRKEADWEDVSPIPDFIAQHKPGAKMDQGKVHADLLVLMGRALMAVAWVGTYGETKYTRGGFLEVPDAFNRYTAAMFRHVFKEEIEGTFDLGDPFYETEEGEPFKGTVRHDAQVAWNALARLEIRLREEAEKGE